MKRIVRHLNLGVRNQGGFTLIELLVVIIIIAVLASIAIPTYMGQREKAQDTAAYSIVRNALTALQSAFVDTGDYTKISVNDLQQIEPTINWVLSNSNLVSTNPAWISNTLPANASARQVAFYPQSPTIADLASVSASGNSFGIQVDTVTVNDTGYVKVKVVDGSADLGW